MNTENVPNGFSNLDDFSVNRGGRSVLSPPIVDKSLLRESNFLSKSASFQKEQIAPAAQMVDPTVVESTLCFKKIHNSEGKNDLNSQPA